MAGGLAALLDDIAAMAKLAAASVDDIGAAAGRASAKAAGVVVDDAAVTPRYVTGMTPDRELPMIKAIAKGSLINKLLIILPVALLLSQFLPWLLTPLLMLGGTYLSFEGAEKLWEKLRGHSGGHAEPAVLKGPEQEKALTSGAIRTDFILSSEIMVIALNEVVDEPLLNRALILVVVAIAITLGVYGVVALIVKMDDIGLRLSQRANEGSQKLGELLVKGMPKVLAVLSVVGVVAMLWVGGHILLVGTKELGWPLLYDGVHHLEELVREATGPLGATLAWVTNTFFSFLIGLAVGAVVVTVLHLLPFGPGHHDEPEDHVEVAGVSEQGMDLVVVPAGAVAVPGSPAADPVAEVALQQRLERAPEASAAEVSTESPSQGGPAHRAEQAPRRSPEAPGEDGSPAPRRAAD